MLMNTEVFSRHTGRAGAKDAADKHQLALHASARKLQHHKNILA